MRVTESDVILKVVVLFLIGMAVLAMFGKFKLPWQKRLTRAKCPSCGRYRIGKGPCDCGPHKGRGGRGS